MTLPRLIPLVVVALLCAGDANADTIRVDRRTVVRRRPTRRSGVVAHLRAGKRARVIRRRGDWVRVRIGVRAGWVRDGHAQPEPEPEPTPDPPKRAGDGWRQQSWLRTGGSQHRGPLRSGDRPFAAAAAAVREAPPAAPAAPAAAGVLRPGEDVRLRTAVRGGFASVAMRFASDGSGPLSAYRVTAQAAAVTARAELLVGLGDRWLAGVDGAYRGVVARPGLRFAQADGVVRPFGFALHQLDTGALLGVQTGDDGGFALFARVGAHYGLLDVESLDNPALMPREDLRGATAGLRAEIPRSLDGDLAMRFGADVLVAGRRRQTPGLEDGERADAAAAWASFAVAYRASRSWTVDGAYRYGWASTSWSGESSRQPDVDQAVRTDRVHTFAIGTSLRF